MDHYDKSFTFSQQAGKSKFLDMVFIFILVHIPVFSGPTSLLSPGQVSMRKLLKGSQYNAIAPSLFPLLLQMGESVQCFTQGEHVRGFSAVKNAQ